MLIQQLNRTDPDRVLISIRNVDGSGSITTGMGACLVQAGASINGINAVRSTAGTWLGFCGVARSDIAINDYGLVTAWGYAASINISNVGTSLTITRGDILVPSAVAGAFFSSLTNQALSTLLYRYAYAATTTVAVSAEGWIDGVVRAL